jgi:serine protease Do
LERELMKSNKLSGWLTGTAVGFVIAAGAVGLGATAKDWHGAVNSPPGVAPARTPDVPGAPLSFADVFAKVSPAVVSIEITGRAGPNEVAMTDGAPGDGSGAQTFPFPFNFPFAFGQNNGQGWSFRQIVPGNSNGGEQPKIHAAGSGFFISPDGYIVTNNHVVEHADTISVHTADGKVLKARLIGRDPATDLAVVKVDGGNFPFVSFEESAKPRVGDWVVAIGNPFGLGGTATAGIVSALDRENVADSSLIDYLQIDAPINKGNSGGPTFDVEGHVVGVNTAIFSPSGGSVGIGFDIPADVAKTITSQLISYGKVEHGFIGATIQQITPDLAESLGRQDTHGALVASVTPGGPSERGGLESGDVVEAINGHPVTSASDLTRQVAFAHPGDTLRLTVLRNGRQQSVELRAGLRPSEEVLAGRESGDDGDGSPDSGAAATRSAPAVLGMRLAELTPAERQRFNIGDAARGVVVEGVGSDTDAQDKGLRAGDVIVKAGERTAGQPSDVRTAVAEASRENRKDVLLLINRGGHTLFVPVQIKSQAQG